jgi:hypothetical protein
MRTVIVFVAGILLVSTVEAASLKNQVRALERRMMTLEKENIGLRDRVEMLEKVPTAPHIVDALGQVVGIVIDQATVFNGVANLPERVTILFDAAVVMQIEGIPTIVRVTPDDISGFPSAEGAYITHLNFDGAGCTGTAFVTGTSISTFGGRALSFAGNLHVPNPEPGVLHTLASRVRQAPNGDFICENDTFQTEYTEALTVPLSIFDKFIPPFSLVGLPQLP